jgi:hypothetical protein
VSDYLFFASFRLRYFSLKIESRIYFWINTPFLRLNVHCLRLKYKIPYWPIATLVNVFTKMYILEHGCFPLFQGGCRDHDHMVVLFTTTCGIGACLNPVHSRCTRYNIMCSNLPIISYLTIISFFSFFLIKQFLFIFIPLQGNMFCFVFDVPTFVVCAINVKNTKQQTCYCSVWFMYLMCIKTV